MFQDHEGTTTLQDSSLKKEKEKKGKKKRTEEREQEHIEETKDVGEGDDKEGEQQKNT